MDKYIAFLRGVNVGGNNKVSMSELKESLLADGFKDVITYINSGNIIFSIDEKDRSTIKALFEKTIDERFQISISVCILSDHELKDALANAPVWWGQDEGSKHNAIMVIPPTTVEEVLEGVGRLKEEYEKVASLDKIIFWSAPIKTFSKTRWSKVVGAPIYDRITIRNANTMKKIAERIG